MRKWRTCYFSGRLPDKEELASFCELINDNMALEQKTKMNIIELEGNNIMNILSRSVLKCIVSILDAGRYLPAIT